MEIEKSDPLFMQAYEIIKKKILTGEFKPAERLFEVHIAKELGVSRNPIREALRLLTQDGLVCATENGQIVHPMTIDDVREIYECRMMVEPFAGALAAKRITPEEVQLLNKYVDQAEKSYLAGDIDGTIEANSAFHNSIVFYSRNQRAHSIFKNLDNLVVMSRNIEMKVHHRPLDYLDEHREMAYLLETGNDLKIKNLIVQHITADWKYFKKCFGVGISDSIYKIKN